MSRTFVSKIKSIRTTTITLMLKETLFPVKFSSSSSIFLIYCKPNLFLFISTLFIKFSFIIYSSMFFDFHFFFVCRFKRQTFLRHLRVSSSSSLAFLCFLLKIFPQRRPSLRNFSDKPYDFLEAFLVDQKAEIVQTSVCLIFVNFPSIYNKSRNKFYT